MQTCVLGGDLSANDPVSGHKYFGKGFQVMLKSHTSRNYFLMIFTSSACSWDGFVLECAVVKGNIPGSSSQCEGLSGHNEE